MNSISIDLVEQTELAPEDGFWIALRRDLAVAMQSKGELAQALAFMAIVVSLFPLAVGPEAQLLKRIAPGVVWVAALLAGLLTLPRIFASDYQDGTLEQVLLSPYPLPVLCAGKALAHWLTTGLPLTVLAPLLGLQYGLGTDELGVLVASLMLGTPVMSMLGAIGGALTLGVRGGSILMALLVLPLFVPVLIFGAGAVEQAMSAQDPSANLSLLGAGLLASLVLTPWAIAAALRISLD